MILIIYITASLLISCTKQEIRSDNTDKTVKITDSTVSSKFALSDKQKKVLEGAKKCLEAKFNYDMEMGYHVLKYKDGELTGSKVFPKGDLDPMLGVCTDVTVRALRWGGVCDLQEEIYNDIKSKWSDYPMSHWGAKKPDQNIDHRRVPNQMVWFKKYWQSVTDEKYQPGDVVAWDMNEDGWGDHIGIVSNKFDGEKPYLIHNFPSPGYVAEEDVLNEWKILAVYRIKD